jgi:hypothetical protein
MDRARLLLKAVELKLEEKETKGWPKTRWFIQVLGRQQEELVMNQKRKHFEKVES